MRLAYLQAGQIVTTHGVRGEVKVQPWADDAQFLCGFSRVRIDGKPYRVARCRVQKECNLLKLDGVDSLEAGEALRGKIVEIFRCDAPADTVFAAELIGMEVYDAQSCIGTITQVLDYPGNKVYVVRGEHAYLIPAVKQFILSTDVERNEMRVRLIEGMRSDEN